MSAAQRTAPLLALALGLLVLPFASGHEGAYEHSSGMTVGDEYGAMVAAIAKADGVAPFMAEGELLGESQVPTPIDTNTTGTFYIAIGANTAAWALEVTDIAMMTYSHLHYGNSTTAGPVLALLAPAAGAYDPPLSGSIIFVSTFNSSAVVLPDVANPTLKDLTAAIMAGDVYANVHTVAAPGGIVRGQLGTM